MKNEYTLFKHMSLRGLDNLEHLLLKAEEFVRAQNQSDSIVLEAKIAQDMLPFKDHVQIFTDGAKGAISTFAQIEKPKYEDNEKTIVELIDRVKKTRLFIQGIDDTQFDNTKNVQIRMSFLPGKYYTSEVFVQDLAIQGTFFHLTIAYAILRHIGVKIGMKDYLGEAPMMDDEKQ